MVQSAATSVDAYLKSLPENRRRPMERILAIARRAMVGFEERMEHGMPCYRRGPNEGAAFASQVRYISLYVGEDVLARHRARLGKARTGKSCVRFTHPDQIDFDLVESMFRASARRRSG